MILIGLTGSIATGKTSCSKLLEATDGVSVIDCDKLVHQLQSPGSAAVKAIKKAFPTVVNDKNELDRAALGQIIFADPVKRRQLGAIMNRFIFTAVIKMLMKLWLTKPRKHIVILDAPTLYETKIFVKIVSSVIVVSCPENKQLERLMSRNQYSREDAMMRIKSQIPNDEKKLMADFVIDNGDDGVESLPTKVADAVQWIRQTQGCYKAPLMMGGLAATVAAVACAVTAVPLMVSRSMVGGSSITDL